ncbi:MAG: DUF5685 family protein [Candidatus Fimenecus sp.]|nr:DUF5685 family protein [Candidatus Fimenecus sp.]
MFGYVKPDKPELKIKDYETYKAIYCSLCRTLGKEYGLLARFLLTYDAAFYALLKKSVLQEKPDCAYKGVCRFNPLKKCNYIDTDSYLKDAAALTVIMFYYKVLDNINDGKPLKRLASRLVYPYIKIKFNKAVKKYSKYNNIIKVSTDEQARIENEKTDSIDIAAHPTAVSLQKILSDGIKDETQKRIVERIGYCLGRWVYLMDAFDDLENDIKAGVYNPFALKYKLDKSFLTGDNKAIEDDIIKSIRLTANETGLALELLDKNCYKPLIENIIFDGMEAELMKIINKKRGDLIE